MPHRGRQTDVDLLQVFHLHLPRCNVHNTKGRLCHDHPNCVERLKRGMKSAPFWRAISDQVAELGPIPNVVARPSPAVPGTLRGLVNLGATCFFNVFIQCLFSNSTFREAIYDHCGDDDVILELQLLFTSLQCSSNAVCDPTRLIELLGLKTDQQQDVQEFSHLFLTLLGHRLKKGFISSQYEGSFIHKTVCLRCHRSSLRRSKFTELCIPITKDLFTIEYCLATYLNAERLSGNNRYHCETCNDKCNADRSLELEQIPPILHIQLMRFVYNRKTQTNVKLHIAVDIPLILSFQNTDSKEVIVYDLSTVILHTGESTHSGHYYAEVRDELTGVWTRLNDGEVGPGQLVQGPNTRRICSDTAYMLVYTRRGRPLRRFAQPSATLQLQVRERDTMAAVSHDAVFERQQSFMKFLTTRRQQISSFWDICSMYSDSDDFYLIEHTWLHDWLRGQRGDSKSHEDGRILNKSLLCSDHGRVDPRKITEFVRLSPAAWKFLNELNGCDMELPRNMLCRDCALSLPSENHLQPAAKRQRTDSDLDQETLLRLKSVYKRGRPFPASQPPTIEKLYLLPTSWFLAMNTWLKTKTAATLPGPVSNDTLLCQHGCSRLAYVSADGVPIQMPSAKSLIGSLQYNGATSLMAIPEEDWLLVNEVFSCHGGPITITLTNVDASRPRLARQWTAVKSTIKPELCRDSQCVAEMEEARNQLLSPPATPADSGVVQIQRLDSSTRRALATLDVRFSWTVGQLKEQIAAALGTSIQVHQLSFEEIPLDNDHLTLEELAIPNEALLTIRLPEVSDQTNEDAIEEGFYDTKLFKAVAVLMEKERQENSNDAVVEAKARFIPVSVNPFNIFHLPTDEEKRRAMSRFTALIRAQESMQEPLL